jgi:hypothetical protein
MPRFILDSTGTRKQIATLIAGALEPELFCLDLYTEFDVDRLARFGGKRQDRPELLCAANITERMR